MTHSAFNLRDALTAALQNQNINQAMVYANSLINEDNRSKPYGFVNKAFAGCDQAMAALYPLRVALLSSFSIEFIHDCLKCYGFINGFAVEIYQAGFAQYRQEILDPASRLYKFQPDVVVLAVEGKHFCPALYERYSELGDDDVIKLREQVANEWRSLIDAFRKNSKATLLLHDFADPFPPSLGIADNNVANGQIQAIRNVNHTILQACKQQTGVFVVNYSGLIGKHGHEQWYDPRMDLYAQAPIAQAMFPHLIREYMKYFRALAGKTKKCLVVDLDNTLWGGVVGEDGAQEIQIGQIYPGNAYLAFQRYILNLYQRGIILAIASKNNLADVEEVFETNPNMLLKKSHFSCLEINWNPKSQSIANIAKHLGIGMEHIVFADDNPAECEQVREALPQVTVIPLGKQPERFVNAVSLDGWFDSLSLSVEDRVRNQLYQQRQESEELLNNSASLEEFYHNLGMTLIFDKVNQQSRTRAAQLTQKTNQLNLTTRRYTETEIVSRIENPNWFVSTVQVTDRYGDNGIVGLLMAEKSGGNLRIDTFLLSCRVIGRAVETAMLVFVAHLAKESGVDCIIGEMIPTAKNVLVRDLYQQHDFLPMPGQDNRWILQTQNANLIFPQWFRVINHFQE
jgi:FkbH-like protein